MAESEHWSVRRQRVAKCKVHGLHYDPRLTSGCALCRKEGLGAEPRQKPQTLVLLLLILAITVIIYRVFGPGAIRADVPSAEPAATSGVALAAAPKLDPERYRPAMEAVDRALFDIPAASQAEMRDQILVALRRLSRQLRDRQSAGSREAAAAVDQLADAAAANELSVEVLQRLRADWTQLRRRYFKTASWFAHRSVTDLDAGRVTLVAYREVADGLMSLLDEGSSRAQILAEPTPLNLVNVEEEEARRREEWRLFQADWSERIAQLRQRLPARPGAGADPRVLVATQRLEQAFTQIDSLASGTLPSRARITNAFAATEKARQSFDDLLLQ